MADGSHWVDDSLACSGTDILLGGTHNHVMVHTESSNFISFQFSSKAAYAIAKSLKSFAYFSCLILATICSRKLIWTRITFTQGTLIDVNTIKIHLHHRHSHVPEERMFHFLLYHPTCVTSSLETTQLTLGIQCVGTVCGEDICRPLGQMLQKSIYWTYHSQSMDGSTSPDQESHLGLKYRRKIYCQDPDSTCIDQRARYCG